MLKTEDVKNLLIEKYKNQEFRITKTGVKTIELQGIQFEADKDSIIREPNYDYAKRPNPGMISLVYLFGLKLVNLNEFLEYLHSFYFLIFHHLL